MKKAMDVALENENEASAVLAQTWNAVKKLQKQLDKANTMHKIATSNHMQALVHRKVQKAMQDQYSDAFVDDECKDFEPDVKTKESKAEYESK